MKASLAGIEWDAGCHKLLVSHDLKLSKRRRHHEATACRGMPTMVEVSPSASRLAGWQITAALAQPG